ncbi:MAG: cache domain-containing protein [Methanospirillum sp.]|uniref:cache domain-containing protein n=1 Tax=Methanospirillum sp. TaxID=45200 RepID=UPI00236DBB9F|nr:cache domain-containing protein [Methanospirillum sp.]MDD1730448.1 cache domain-containing protein [Methanospirillum sp.]
MRSIFWIGCTLAVLVSLLVSGAIAESVNNSTVQATGALDVNKTTAPDQVAASVNVTDKAANVTAPVANATGKSAVNASAAAPDLVNDTLVKFVTDARTYALNNGKSAAITTFNSPAGPFVNDKMYIFAYDLDGKALALPYAQGSVGMNQIALTDSTGLRYVQQMCDLAKHGVGFVKYQEPNLMKQGTVMNKVSYITNVDGTYWIGAGVYLPKEDKKAAAKPEVASGKDQKTAVNATNTTLPAETSAKDTVKAAVKELVNNTVSNLTA